MLDFDASLTAAVVAGFGATVLHARAPAEPFAVPAVFDRAHVAVLEGEGPVASALRAVLTVRLGDYPSGFVPEQGDQVQVALIAEMQVPASPLAAGAALHAFVVSDVQRDGGGGAVLVLEAA